MKIPISTLSLSACLLLSACTLGPDHVPPDTIDTTQLRYQDGWQPVPADSWAASGSWWTAFDDEALSQLVEQSLKANQTLAQAEARYRAAEAQWRQSRGARVPELGVGLGATRSGGSDRSTASQYDARLQVGWAPDLWGRVRRTIEADQAGMQASAADLAAVRLALQVAVAESYINLRALDRQQEILRDTLAGYERSASLTRNQYQAGIVARSDVIQAQTQLQSLRTDLYDLQAARAREQNALAALLGVAPVQLSLAEEGTLPAVPTLPRSLPATLIARRPDVVAAERQVAAANARIGVARTAWLPDVTLDLWGGVQSGSFSGLFDAPARVWSLGPSLAQALLDGGQRSAALELAVARHEEQAAFYRQTVIDSLRELEDVLATLQILGEKAEQQAALLQLAEENERVANNRYRAGQVSFLEVVTAQNITLAARRVAVDIHAQRLAATVQLAAIIGGGWDLEDPVIQSVLGE